MRVVHVDTSTELRGGQRQLQLLVAGLRDSGVDQAVVRVPGSPLDGVLGDVERIDARPGGDPRNLPVLHGIVCDVLAAHTSQAHQVSVLAGRRPVVHRRVDFPVSGGVKYRRALGYVCVSQAVADVLPADCSTVVVHDGVEPLASMPPAEVGPGRVVLAVGALVDHKDHATLALAAQGLDARVLVAGEGPLRSELEATALELLGQRTDVAALFARADVFVHPSKLEGMGQVVVEALLAGCVVVATRAGGVPEVVGAAGLLVPPQDPDALRGALRRALDGDHPSTDVARARGGLFSVQRMVDGTRAAYARFLAPTGVR
ncbi:MAG: glycosyltransferase [Proteobacteria bacterium]|nr:glycosyltransferase [Pseudomonadota bacterium]MCP4920264.1 glycosyltransferase [Pseudomonadota bacterium]